MSPTGMGLSWLDHSGGHYDGNEDNKSSDSENYTKDSQQAFSLFFIFLPIDTFGYYFILVDSHFHSFLEPSFIDTSFEIPICVGWTMQKG